MGAVQEAGFDPSNPWQPPRWVVAAILLLSVTLVWFSPFDHPLYPPDEGRYGAVAANMVESGDWTVPTFRGEPHLTKPPLTYWLQAVGVAIVGRDEIAVRVPALLASSVVVLLLYGFVRRERGSATGLCAAALYAVLPEALIVGRMGSTDAILNLFWVIGLGSGYRAIQSRSLAAAMTFWAATALAGLAKGPLAAGPFVILLTWLVIAGRWRAIFHLRPLVGIPLSLVPLGAWLAAVGLRDPQIFGIWVQETIGRASGSLGKDDVWWFYIPLFFVAFFPATAMMVLPTFNLSYRNMWRRFRDGSLETLAVLAVLLPLIGFSISKGKLPTYLLPLSAPMAFLVGSNVASWLSGRFDAIEASGHAEDGTRFRPPDVRWTLLISFLVAAIAIGLGPWLFAPHMPAVPVEAWDARVYLVLPLAGAIGLVVAWRSIVWRRRAFVVMWLCVVGLWAACFELEDDVNVSQSGRHVAQAIRDLGGRQIAWIGKPDQTMRFYLSDEIKDLGDLPSEEAIEAALAQVPLVVVDQRAWDGLVARGSGAVGRLEPVGTHQLFFNRSVIVCRVRSAA